MRDIRDWLEGLGLGAHAEAFEAEQIDLEALPDITEADLKDMGLPIGPRRKLLRAVAGLAAMDTETEAPAAPREAERRQITVMFCDLVGSTALSEQLDPEDLRTLMQAYQKAAGTVIERYGGHVAQYLGDGLMTYFGWPQAHEDDAERAVRAGLDIIDAVKTVAAPTPLQVRIGIATGPVVVGETGAGDASVPKLAVGETPNLAARLQGLAGSDEVIVGPSTRRLIGETFDLDDLGEQALKGILDPINAWRATAIAASEGRFEARHQHLTPLVGRDAEMAMVMARWEQACAGEGQLIVLGGEPGIGKSRITQALRDKLADEPHTRLRYQCSPYHMNSALHPIIEQIERAAGFARDDDADAKLDKLEALLATPPSPKSSPARGEDFPTETPSPLAGEGRGEGDKKSCALFASLLSLPTDRYPPLAMSPQKQKEETLSALVDQVAALTVARPVLLIFEDAHWIDPTSQELLDLIVPALAGHQVLAVITHRPEYDPPWLGQGHVTPLALNRLGRAEAAAMVARVSDTPLPDAMLEQIVAKTDGVPLFVEELTKTVLESGTETVTAIPETLQDSLMARLDRLSPVKEITQIGACIGREFPYELLAAVSPLGDNELRNSLTELTNSDLVFRRGTPPDATYIFKHALVQDAAYESLLKSTRQQLHTTIAEAFEGRFPEQAENAPELVAHHYTRAGLAARAIPFWLRAGEQAVARFANLEAISHLNQGLDLITELPDADERARQELALRLALGPALMVVNEYIGQEVAANFRSMRAVSEQLKDTAGLAAAFLGLHRYLAISGELNAAYEQDVDNLRLAETIQDPRLLTTAHWALGGSNLWLGNFAAARDHAGAAFQDVTFDNDKSFIASHLEAPGATCRCFAAISHLLLGSSQQAAEIMDTGLDLADRLAHPFVIALGQLMAGMSHYIRREPTMVLRATDRLSAVCAEVEIPALAPGVTVFRAWALVRQQDQAGQAELERARKAMEFLVPIWQPMWAPILLESDLITGNYASAASRFREGLAHVEKSSIRFSQAELLRLRGDLARAMPDTPESEAESWFEKALEVARRQEAKWWELRAATSLARLWQSQGKTVEARALLAPVYGWFTEGFDTADLIDAKALLDELGSD